MINKIDSSAIPEDVMKDLKILKIDNYKEYINVGSNYYELFPTQSTKLLNIIGDILDMIDSAKLTKVEKLRELGFDFEDIKNQYISIQDVLAIDANKERIKNVMNEILEGVDAEDFEKMTISQILDILAKLVKINIESFPESFKANFFRTVVDSANLADTTSQVVAQEQAEANAQETEQPESEEETGKDFLDDTPTSST